MHLIYSKKKKFLDDKKKEEMDEYEKQGKVNHTSFFSGCGLEIYLNWE